MVLAFCRMQKIFWEENFFFVGHNKNQFFEGDTFFCSGHNFWEEASSSLPSFEGFCTRDHSICPIWTRKRSVGTSVLHAEEQRVARQA